MPKKNWGTNEKVEEARNRKSAGKKASAEKAAKAKEDAYWAAHDNPRGKKDLKREEDHRKKEEAAARKAENKRLAALEEATLASSQRKKGASAQKVTAHQLALLKEKEKRELEKAKELHKDHSKRHVDEEGYASMVDVENRNRELGGGVDARTVDAALIQLSMNDECGKGEGDKHPEKRSKAAFAAYYEEKLPGLKESKPGLRLMQYKSMIFEMWQKDPRNPRNQMNT